MTVNCKSCNQCGVNDVRWNIIDVAFVMLILIVGCASLFVISLICIKDRKSQFLLFSYAFPLLCFFIPFFWLKIKYNITLKSLGLTKGKYPFRKQLAIGALAALFMYGVVAGTSPSINKVEIAKKAFDINSIIALLLVPFSSFGIAKFIFTPIGEELLLRGFLYGYLRKKLNLKIAIVIQAIISTLMHLGSFKEVSFSYYSFNQGIQLGLIFLVLAYIYDATKSLYPCIICHGMYNFLWFACPFFL